MRKINDAVSWDTKSTAELPTLTRWMYGACKPLIAMHEFACKRDLAGQMDSFKVRAPRAGIHLHMLDGKGTGGLLPVVLLPGLTGSAASYSACIKKLLPHTQRLVAIDPPNHGESDALVDPQGDCRARFVDAVEDVLAATLPTSPYLLLGHSLGGWLAMELGRRNPAQCRGMVLIGTDGAPWQQAPLEQLKQTVRRPDFASIREVASTIWPQTPVAAILQAPFVGAQFAQERLLPLIGGGLIAPSLSSRELSELASLQGAITLIWGQHEKFGGTAARDYLMGNLPAGTVLSQPDANHGAILEATDAIMAAILAGLGRRSGSAKPNHGE
jgi:pimeloyl-ACP methyl ester carboxylesterase